MIAALADAADAEIFGGKAAQLALALRAGLPVPADLAVSHQCVETVAGSGEDGELVAAAAGLGSALAVRSSAVGEDSAEASFAGQHLTELNVDPAGLAEAVAAVWRSARSEAALGYRRRLGLDGERRVGAVVQRLVVPEKAGVLFTRNPFGGADEKVIEASWGPGESVIADRVVPDRVPTDRAGSVVERAPGWEDTKLSAASDGGTAEEAVPPELVEAPCLDDAELAELHGLADRCEPVFGPDRDIEWAIADELLYLLQCRPITAAAT